MEQKISAMLQNKASQIKEVFFKQISIYIKLLNLIFLPGGIDAPISLTFNSK